MVWAQVLQQRCCVLPAWLHFGHECVGFRYIRPCLYILVTLSRKHFTQFVLSWGQDLCSQCSEWVLHLHTHTHKHTHTHIHIYTDALQHTLTHQLHTDHTHPPIHTHTQRNRATHDLLVNITPTERGGTRSMKTRNKVNIPSMVTEVVSLRSS